MTEAQKHFAVIGHPINHSLSPKIHTYFAKEAGLAISYEAILSPLDKFNETLHTLMQKHYGGINVTLPFKKEAYLFSQHHSKEAKIAEAVNTLVFKSGEVTGHNTDGLGLVGDLTFNLKVTLHQKKILLMGAGGAAEGVIYSLLENKPLQLTLTNRTIEKSMAIKHKMDEYAEKFHVDLNVIEIKKLAHHYYDVIINATSASLHESELHIDDKVFHTGSFAYDMMYGKETYFIKKAKSQHAKTSDGLGMLVEQAAEAFYIWHGIKPDTKSVIDLLSAS
ncbi:MAG: shikimate dehydrogenase [Candidatus Methylopumilus sp.]|nr:shikimate dehydrogenase [Candidatus Methylopumilus sp.]